MLELGVTHGNGGSLDIGLTPVESRSHFAAWCIVGENYNLQKKLPKSLNSIRNSRISLQIHIIFLFFFSRKISLGKLPSLSVPRSYRPTDKRRALAHPWKLWSNCCWRKISKKTTVSDTPTSIFNYFWPKFFPKSKICIRWTKPGPATPALCSTTPPILLLPNHKLYQPLLETMRRQT